MKTELYSVRFKNTQYRFCMIGKTHKIILSFLGIQNSFLNGGFRHKKRHLIAEMIRLHSDTVKNGK